MTYQQHHEVFTNKAAGYSALACQHAIADCHQTLRDFGAGIDKAYETKLWAEIDAMRERLAALQR